MSVAAGHSRARRARQDAAAPPGAVDALLAAKMYVPAPRPGWVGRPELLAVLNARPGARLVTVVAGAGYGKSTLLALWQADPGRARALAVLAVDAGDDDPVVFWSEITAALAAAAPAPGWDRVRALVAQQSPDLTGAVLPALLSALAAAAAAGPLTLALDDFHLVTSPACHAQLGFVVAHLPPGCQVLLAARAAPPMPVARLRAAGELAELGPDQLRLSGRQAAALIAGVAAGLPAAGLPAAALEPLLRAAEGWPAALYLAARALRSDPDPAALPGRLAAARGHLAGLITEEVLSGLEPGQVTALVRCSILDRFCAPLCRAVAGDGVPPAGPPAGSDLLVIPLDEQGTWFRRHHLVQRVLRGRLAAEEPELIPELHRRAAAWLAGHGLPGEAIDHALAAGDTGHAVTLIAAVYPAFLGAGRRQTVRGWLSRLGAGVVAASAPAAIAAAWTAAVSGDRAAVAHWLAAAEHSGYQGPLPDGTRTVSSAVALVRAVFGFDGFKAMAEAAHTAAEHETDPTSAWHGMACLALGQAGYLAGRCQDAIPLLEAAVAGQATMPVVRVSAAAVAALCHDELGHHQQAGDAAATAARLAGESGFSQTPQGSIVATALAAVAWRHGDLPRARDLLQQALSWRQQVPGLSPWSTLITLLLYARVCLAGHDRATAGRLIEDAEELLRQLPDPASPLAGQLSQLRRDLHAAPRRTRLPEPLTSTEHDLLRQLPGPLTLPQIARQRHVSVNTLKTQTRAIYRKLGATGRQHAIDLARRQGLIPPAPQSNRPPPATPAPLPPEPPQQNGPPAADPHPHPNARWQ